MYDWGRSNLHDVFPEWPLVTLKGSSYLYSKTSLVMSGSRDWVVSCSDGRSFGLYWWYDRRRLATSPCSRVESTNRFFTWFRQLVWIKSLLQFTRAPIFGLGQIKELVKICLKFSICFDFIRKFWARWLNQNKNFDVYFRGKDIYESKFIDNHNKACKIPW